MGRMTSTERAATQAAAPGDRIEGLDVLRGVAVLGTLGTNIWIFTNPWGPADPGVAARGETVGGIAERALLFLSNGKFLALLTLLFGIGLELQYRSAVRRGVRWPGRYLGRAAILLAEGSLHYVLIFEFDVLMSYAVTSVIVAYLIGRSDRVVRAAMVAAGAVHLLLVAASVAMLGVLGEDAGRDLDDAVPAGLYTDGGYRDQVVHRIDQAAVYRAEAIFILPMSVALFLLGARLLRAGVFDSGDRGSRLRTRLIRWGLGVGVPLNLWTSLAGPFWLVVVDRYVLPVAVALGLLALVTSLVQRMAAPGRLRRGLTAVGRTALSCYVLQNLAASALCYGWGLGLAARLAETGSAASRWGAAGLWAGISGLCTVVATLWLRRFDRGPLETLAGRLLTPGPRRARPSRPAPGSRRRAW